MECLAFRAREVRRAVSLQLGCVRLMEQFVADPSAPAVPTLGAQIAAHCAAVVAASGFAFDLPAGAVAVGTGGTVTTVRAILAAQGGVAFDATSPEVRLDTLRSQLRALGAMTLADRRQIAGLPAARADVFPTALATLIAVAELGHFPAFRNSVYNLRFGLAREALDGM
jgi:exopolyphosphatase/guanosine-5'-triphosphate,3'-diphosphate pyrophosphatase